jgi:DNA-binding GntR family transcriptional regulator
MRVKKAIYDEVKLGKIKIQELMAISEEALAVQHGVSRDTIRRAKNNILAEIVEDKNLD